MAYPALPHFLSDQFITVLVKIFKYLWLMLINVDQYYVLSFALKLENVRVELHTH